MMHKYNPSKKEKEYKQKQYQIRYMIDKGICQRCNIPINTMGHRIAQTYYNIIKYGWKYIQHNFNISLSCNKCNPYFNIGMKDIKCNKLVELINERGQEPLTSKEITRYISE